MDNEKKYTRVVFPELGFEFRTDESGPESPNTVRHLLSDKPIFRPAPYRRPASDKPGAQGTEPVSGDGKPN